MLRILEKVLLINFGFNKVYKQGLKYKHANKFKTTKNCYTKSLRDGFDQL